MVRSPAYVEEFPNERDVDAYVSSLARLGGGSGSVPASLREAWSAGYRDKPKGWYRGPFKFDGQGHTWIAINRDRDAWSFIEVWAGPNYLRTVVVRDRLISYDLLGKTLVVLVERSPGPDGIAKLAIDWYEVPDLAAPVSDAAPSHVSVTSIERPCGPANGSAHSECFEKCHGKAMEYINAGGSQVFAEHAIFWPCMEEEC